MRIKSLKITAVAFTAALMSNTVFAETVLRLGHVWPNSEIHAKAAEQFAEDVAAATNGEVRIAIHGGGTLGSDRELLEGIKFQANDIWVGGAGVLSSASKAAKVFTIPFMIRDINHFEAVYDGPVGENLSKQIKSESGYEIISYWLRGPRWLTTNKSIQAPEDLAGLKIRVPDSPVFVKSWNTLGAAATPLSFGELFSALQQGVVDGQENPLSLIQSARFSEVVKFLVRTEHAYEPIVVVMDGKRLAAMPEDHRNAIIAAANGQAKAYASEEVLKGEKTFVTQLQQEGMTLVEPDKAQFQARVNSDFVASNFENIASLYQRIVEVKAPSTK